MWRWSQEEPWSSLSKLIFSTYVEVILIFAIISYNSCNFLHVCGGDPITTISSNANKLFSPRMWRWSQLTRTIGIQSKIFSTYVEVILILKRSVIQTMNFLHVCGGDPESETGNDEWKKFSPRMWRWSSPTNRDALNELIFSTYVEVIPIS